MSVAMVRRNGSPTEKSPIDHHKTRAYLLVGQNYIIYTKYTFQRTIRIAQRVKFLEPKNVLLKHVVVYVYAYSPALQITS